MKNWKSIKGKYVKTELMQEFRDYCPVFYETDIQTVFGWIQCFAETKGFLEIKSRMIRGIRYTNGYFYNKKEWYSENFDNPEQAMLWCADCFFKLGEKNEV